MRRLLLLLCLLPLLLSANEWSERLESGILIRVSTDRDSLLIDEEVELRLDIEYPPGWSIDSEALAPQSLHSLDGRIQWEILAESRSTADGDRGRTEDSFRFRLRPRSQGQLPLTFYNLRLIGPRGGTQEVLTPLFQVTVQLPEGRPNPATVQEPLPFTDATRVRLTRENRRLFVQEPSQGEEAAEEILERFEERQFPWLTLFIFSLLLASGLGYWYWRQRADANSTEEAVDVDPRQKALHALEELEAKNWPSQGLFEPFYVAVSAIVRVYIEEKYGIEAPERTTEEFLKLIATDSPFQASSNTLLRDFLHAADMVKFARHAPSTADCSAAGESARKFITQEGHVNENA